MSVVAKFTVTKHTTTKWEGGYGGTTVTLEPRYSKSIPEDQKFHTATPSGIIEMAVDNKNALEQLEVGKVFYVTFEEAPAGTSAYHE